MFARRVQTWGLASQVQTWLAFIQKWPWAGTSVRRIRWSSAIEYDWLPLSRFEEVGILRVVADAFMIALSHGKGRNPKPAIIGRPRSGKTPQMLEKPIGAQRGELVEKQGVTFGCSTFVLNHHLPGAARLGEFAVRMTSAFFIGASIGSLSSVSLRLAFFQLT